MSTTPVVTPSRLDVKSILEGKNVLVVDDDRRNCFAMSELLKQCHAVVIIAESGFEALAILRRQTAVDLVLMDIMMPVMDGYATMRAIRESEQIGHLPIIAVTGKVVSGERQRCLEAGADDYVPKPVNSVELIAAIEQSLLATTKTPSRAVVATGAGRAVAPAIPSPAPLTATVPVLIVADTPAESLSLKAALAPLGCSVIDADSLDTALRRIIVQHFAVIVVGLGVTARDGVELAGLIRQRRQSERTPMIFVIGHPDEEAAYRAAGVEGIDAFILSPVSPDEFRGKVFESACLFNEGFVGRADPILGL